jgi:hypothetical protein
MNTHNAPLSFPRSTPTVLLAGALFSATTAQASDCPSSPEIDEVFQEYQIEVQVLDAGTGPLKPLRYQFQAARNTETRQEEKRTDTAETSQGPQSREVETVDIRVIQEQSVSETHMARVSSATTSTETTVGSPSGETEEHRTTYSISTCGHVFDWTSTKDDFDPDVLPYLPSEPLGVGARWTMRMEQVSNRIFPAGATMLTTYELKSIEGSQLTLHTEMQVNIHPGKNSQEPPMTIRESRAKGSTVGVLDLSRPYAARERSTIQMTLNATVHTPDGPIPVQMLMEGTMHKRTVSAP